jgi:hypothetical protein
VPSFKVQQWIGLRALGGAWLVWVVFGGVVVKSKGSWESEGGS